MKLHDRTTKHQHQNSKGKQKETNKNRKQKTGIMFYIYIVHIHSTANTGLLYWRLNKKINKCIETGKL